MLVCVLWQCFTKMLSKIITADHQGVPPLLSTFDWPNYDFVLCVCYRENYYHLLPTLASKICNVLGMVNLT